ncbi:hypothetical protein IS481_12000 [Caldimonas thermodepolymerans]|uniref:Uncharacterized protein n=1 Tax=Caldimonas thermodepolymerans TaxID=215580 RepID=A0A2S5T907_9BURK|nr:hypothetical protein [Caldimonas thermodepolymerans]PPE71463.1 hypothetical protein C1702_00215 [Caldimonas thermodepolymerans]QPC30492.1 hypothetical protein IS481_12000 [Caldimonas thermodepolymerans]RDI02924.1 hypothetical protein DES46_102352 [Caldimonas thermodepolymerans]
MSNTRYELKVDPTVAYTRTIFVPNTENILDAADFAVTDVVQRARAAGRKPVMVEVTVRVAP